MEFYSRDEVIFQLILSKEIGSGSQGTCYLNAITNDVYKIFNQFFYLNIDEDEKVIYIKDEIMRYSHLINDTFIFPKDVITLNEEVIGYVTNYVKAIPLNQTDPLKVDLNLLVKNIELAHRDIKYLSDHNVSTFDMFYNILYGNKFYVTDTDEFGYTYYEKTTINGITFYHGLFNDNNSLEFYSRQEFDRDKFSIIIGNGNAQLLGVEDPEYEFMGKHVQHKRKDSRDFSHVRNCVFCLLQKNIFIKNRHINYVR